MTDDTHTQLQLLHYKAEMEALITEREITKLAIDNRQHTYDKTRYDLKIVSDRLFQIQQEIIELKH